MAQKYSPAEIAKATIRMYTGCYDGVLTHSDIPSFCRWMKERKCKQQFVILVDEDAKARVTYLKDDGTFAPFKKQCTQTGYSDHEYHHREIYTVADSANFTIYEELKARKQSARWTKETKYAYHPTRRPKIPARIGRLEIVNGVIQPDRCSP